MNVVLVSPLNERFMDIVKADLTSGNTSVGKSQRIKRLSCVYPVGLLNIGSFVRKHVPEASVHITDLNLQLNRMAASSNFDPANSTLESFLKDVVAMERIHEPAIVGVSAMFCNNFHDMKPMMSFFRKHFPSAVLVAGGHLASASFDDLFAAGVELDGVCYGEGEIPFVELTKAACGGKGIEHLERDPCFVTRRKARDASFVPQSHVVQDLDEIPPYDLSMLSHPEDYYHSYDDMFITRPMEGAGQRRSITLFSTRGCPNRCTFCASQHIHGHVVRYYSTQRVKQDILEYQEKYGIEDVLFSDDHFLAKKERALELLRFAHDRGMVAHNCQYMFYAVDGEVARTMRETGTTVTVIAIESGNEETLKRLVRKPSSLRKAREAIEHLRGQGIVVIANAIIGFPGETKAAIEAGIQTLVDMGANWYKCLIATPLPGSEMYEICKRNGYFVDGADVFGMDFKRCIIRTPDFEPDYIEEKVYEMNLRLNFVENYDMRHGEYRVPLMLFERVFDTGTTGHAFAFYYAAKCCAELGLNEKYRQYRQGYEDCVRQFPFWQKWVRHFSLGSLPVM